MEQKHRVLVVGCGGIGGIFASHLGGRSDVDLSVVSRNPSIVDAVRRDGLQLLENGQKKVCTIDIHTSIPGGAFDFIFLATQPPQVEDAARDILPHLTSESRVVVLQNGLCEARVAEHIGSNRVLGGIVTFGASTDGPGQVRRTSKGGVVIGAYSGHSDSAMDRLQQLLDGIGVITTTQNLKGARYSKLALNCAVSGLGTLAGVRLGTLLNSPKARNLALAVMREAVEVSKAEGIELEPIGGTFDLNWLANPQASWSGPAHWQRHAMLMVVGFKYRKLRSSMLSAIERGRPAAVDFLNGEVVNMGSIHGIPTPINRDVAQLIHDIAEGKTHSDPAHLHRLCVHIDKIE